MGAKFGFSFSFKRAVGISSIRQKVAKKIGIPTTKGGLERKIGSIVLGTFRKKKK